MTPSASTASFLKNESQAICTPRISDTIATGISGPRSGGDLARKRYQRGALRREGSIWILRWREDVLNKAGAVVGVERRARVGATKDLPTKALARRVADRMIEHVNQPNYMPGKVATVQEFSEVYCANVCPTFKPSSCESARSLCRIYIEPVLGRYRLDQVKGEVPQFLVNELRHRGLSRKTVLNALSTLASMLGAARGLELSVPRTRLAKGEVARRGTAEAATVLHSRRITADHRRSPRAVEHLFRVYGLPGCAHE